MESDPYKSPEVEQAPRERRPLSLGKEPWIGCGIGGCLMPIGLFILVTLSKSVGIPFLFWLPIALLLAIIGFFAGLVIRLVK